LGVAGANEKGIGRGHEAINVAFFSGGRARRGTTGVRD
jgi:hypothetical protein